MIKRVVRSNLRTPLAVKFDLAANLLLISFAKPANLFCGYRGFRRRSIKVGSSKMMSRSVVVDLAARKVLNRSVTVVDRARLESEWNSAPGYS
jgi:hypothetical protein